jgi:pimeloyl-ACP methyl ester carboxylesterase
VRDTINGTTIEWEEAGAGAAVVLIHGLSENRAAWRHQVEPFSKRFRTILYDVRGFGGSEVGDASGAIEQYAEDLGALAARLRLRHPAIVGFSMGGVIAQRFALDRPGLPSAVVIAASSSVVNARAAAYYRERAALAEGGDLEAVRAASAEDGKGCFARSAPDAIEAYRGLRRAALRDPRGYATACRAMASLHERPVTEELARIRCPALVITGERDAFCPPKAAEIIHRHLPGSRLRIVPGAGHCLHWEDPHGFNGEVLDFLRSAIGPGGPSGA